MRTLASYAMLKMEMERRFWTAISAEDWNCSRLDDQTND